MAPPRFGGWAPVKVNLGPWPHLVMEAGPTSVKNLTTCLVCFACIGWHLWHFRAEESNFGVVPTPERWLLNVLEIKPDQTVVQPKMVFVCEAIEKSQYIQHRPVEIFLGQNAQIPLGNLGQKLGVTYHRGPSKSSTSDFRTRQSSRLAITESSLIFTTERFWISYCFMMPFSLWH